MTKQTKKTNADKAFQKIEEGMKKLAENLGTRRKELEKIAKSNARELRKNLDKQAQSFRKNLDEQLDTFRGQVLDAVGVASKDDLDKLSRKLQSISKKVNDLAA